MIRGFEALVANVDHVYQVEMQNMSQDDPEDVPEHQFLLWEFANVEYGETDETRGTTAEGKFMGSCCKRSTVIKLLSSSCRS